MFGPLGQIKVMIQLHESIMGRRLIEGTMPDIADQLKRIADSLEKLLGQKDLEQELAEVKKTLRNLQQELI